jgi:UDP-glucose 4-epimerase
MSTPDLIRAMGRALHVTPHLMRCPVALLRFVAMCVGKSAELARLTQSLCVDTTRIRNELGWTPPYSVDEGLAATARWYHAHVNDGARVEEAHRAL